MAHTEIDFSKHELFELKSDLITIHYLKKPDTICDSVKFINTEGILAVTGDYSNWIFCREFIPDAKNSTSFGYWKEKLKISSCQQVAKYDSTATEEEIKRLIAESDDREEQEELEELLKHVDDELDYTYFAFRESKLSSRWDFESIPFVKTVDYHFYAILDAFDEICRRLKNNETVKPYSI